MGIFSGIRDAIMGDSKSLDMVISASVKGADYLRFGEQERADYDKEAWKMHLRFVEASANESSAKSITRRLICVPIVYLWLFLILLNVFGGTLGYPVQEVKDGIEFLTPVAMLSITFYTGRHIVNSVVAAIASRKK